MIAEIKSNRVKFSNFYNSVITSRISEILEINPSEPYIEIILISKDTTFIANKTKTFQEEKEVAEKAPIDGILISDLSGKIETKNKRNRDKDFPTQLKLVIFIKKKVLNL